MNEVRDIKNEINVDNDVHKEMIDFMDKVDIPSLKLYPFFELSEVGAPVFYRIGEVEEFLKKFTLDDIKDFFETFSFTDYYFKQTKGIMLSFLIYNRNFDIFCRNKLVNLKNGYFFDQLLSYKLEEVMVYMKEILKSKDDSFMLQLDMVADEVKDKVVQAILQNDEYVTKRLKYNYFLSLVRSYLSFKKLFEIRGAGCLNDVLSEMYEFQKKGNQIDAKERIKWEAVPGKITDNHSLLVLFEALKEVGYLTYGKEDIEKLKLFEGLHPALAGTFLIEASDGPKELIENHVSSIASHIKKCGCSTATKENKYDYSILKQILNEIVEKLNSVTFKRRNVYIPGKIKNNF